MFMLIMLVLLRQQQHHLSREVTDPALSVDPGGHSKLELPAQPFQLGVCGKGQGVKGLEGRGIYLVVKALVVVVMGRPKAFDMICCIWK